MLGKTESYERGQLPTAVVINLSYTGLGLVRSLGRRGIPVIGLSSGRPGQYGKFSRYCRAQLCPDSRNAPGELLDHLLQLGRELRTPAILFPTSDFEVLLIARNQAALREHFRFPQPDTAVVETVMNKAELSRRAEECNVPVPATCVCRNATEVRAAGESVRYPCVIKPVHSYLWHEGDAWNLVGQAKAIKATSREQLESSYLRVSRVTPEVLVQEFVPGQDQDIFVAGLYIGSDRRLRGAFTASKLLQYPRETGTGCIVERVENTEVLSLATRLLEHLNYSGIAEVEFKRDAASGKYKLIEVNPRFWDWHQLSAANGMDLGYTAYLDLSGQPPQQPIGDGAGAWWVADEALLTYLRDRVRRRTGSRELASPRLGRLLLRRNMWGIFSWSDPLPFVVFSADQARATLRSMGRRLFTQRKRLHAGDSVPR